MKNKSGKIIALCLVAACLFPTINTPVRAADTMYLLNSDVEIINSGTGNNQIYLQGESLKATIKGGDMAAKAKGSCRADIGESGYAVVGFTIDSGLSANSDAAIQLDLMSQTEKTTVTVSDRTLSVGGVRVDIGEGKHEAAILFDAVESRIHISIDGKSAGTFDSTGEIPEIITDWSIYAFALNSLSESSEFELSDLYVTNDRSVFDNSILVQPSDEPSLDPSVFRIFETYDELPVNFNMTYTGFSWANASLTSFTATVVKDETENQVLRLKSTKRTTENETDANSASLYGSLELAEGTNIVENDIFIPTENDTVTISVKNGKKSQSLLSVSGGKLTVNTAGTPFNAGAWHTLAVTVDTTGLLYDVMLDGTLVGSGSITEMSSADLQSTACSLYVDVTAPQNSTDEILLDNYKVYAGSEPLSNEELESIRPERFFVEGETGTKSKKLRRAAVFAADTPAAKIFGENETITVEGNEVSPYIDADGRFMLPAEYLSEIYGTDITLSDGAYTETVDGILCISAVDAAVLLGKKCQLHSNGLAILSDSENFYNSETESFEIDMLYKLLKNSKYGLELFTENSEEFFEMVRERIASGEEPYATAWNRTKAYADNWVKQGAPQLYLSGGVNYFFKTGNSVADAVRSCAFVYRVTGEEKYAETAKLALLRWTEEENPFPVYKEVTHGTVWTVNGMHLARVFTAYLYGYSFLEPYLDKETCRSVELLAQRMAAGIKISKQQWQDNDYYGKQYYQNHIDAFIMGIVASGIVTKDLDLLYYALESEANERTFPALIEGAIVMDADDDLCRHDRSLKDTTLVPQAGEMYDRYRTNEHKGLQYAELSSRLLFLTAEMLYQNDCDYFGYYGKNGENLKLPFEFYGDFYLNSTDKIQYIESGYYSGDALLGRYHAIYPMVRVRYPESTKIQYVCDNVYRLAQSDEEIVGWLSALTH